MKALIICDADYQTEVFQNLQKIVHNILSQKGIEIEVVEVGSGMLTFCRGCFGCWIKKPGECVINDAMQKLNQSFMISDAVIYLSAIVFGQFSPNIKNAIDRSLPNILPFFVKGDNGLTSHPLRYEHYPRQLIIGYGEELDNEDKQLFTDITKKHRENIDVLVYEGPNCNDNIIAAFNDLS